MEELKLTNSKILEQLRHGFARFELVSTSTCSVSDLFSSTSLSATRQGNSYLFFANSDYSKRLPEVKYDTNDSRSLFQALAKGMACDPKQEKPSAEELRKAVKEAICNESIEGKTYKKALLAITLEDEPLATHYCERILSPDFFGGRSELLVLSKLYKQPIIVYKRVQENGKDEYILIADFGIPKGLLSKGLAKVKDKLWKKEKKNVVELVFSNKGYDLRH